MFQIIVLPLHRVLEHAEYKPINNQTAMENNQTLVQASGLAKLEVKYETLGQEVKLTPDIVRKYLTKGNGNVTDQEVLQFISVCKYQQLNPFLNEAYLVKFANNRGGEDNAQIIVSKEAFMKRAEGCEQYKGFRAGLILKRGDSILYEEGEFLLPTDVLLGGWAEVYRNDRDYPYKAFVSLSDYDKGRSTWNQIKCTMIRKTAIVHAMREAFPTQLGAMYSVEEKKVEDVDFEDVHDARVQAQANAQPLPDEQPEQHAQPEQKPAQPAQTQEPKLTDTPDF